MSKRLEWLLFCELSDEEKSESAHSLAEKVREYNELEDEAKGVASEYRDRLKAMDTVIRQTAKIVETGQEERPVIVQLDYHQPEQGKKTYIRQDTFEIVKVEDMNPYDHEAYAAEMQFRLQLEA